MPAEIEGVAVFLAPPETRDTGLLAWATVSVRGFRIDGLAVRRNFCDGALSVTWPARRAENGARHSIVSPVDDSLRSRVEAAVLAEYLATARRAGRNRR
jgi:DNA-binding cell septation regulator SpoVG